MLIFCYGLLRKITDTSYVLHATVQQHYMGFCNLTAVQPEHYGDVIMGAIASQITSLTIVYSTVQIKENIKAPRHWPLCGEFTGDR